jgi:hypothetical protein
MRTFADGFRLVSEYPRPVLGPMLAVLVPAGVVTAVITALLYLTVFEDRDPTNPYTFEGEGGELFLILLVSGIQAFFSIVAGAATIAAAAACARRSPIPVVQALDAAFTGVGQILLLLIGFYAAIAVLLFSLIGIPVAIFLSVRLLFALHNMVLEKTGVWDSFRASWSQTRGHFLRIAGLVLLAGLSLAVVAFFVGSLGFIEPSGRNAEIVTIAGVNILQSIVVIPIQAVIISMVTLFYLNLRAQVHDATPA